MESRPTYFRVNTVLPIAIERKQEGEHPPPPALIVGHSLAAEARDQVAVLGSRQPDQYREALNAVLDVVETLERQVEMLHRRMVLDFRKLDLVRRRLDLGGDGFRLFEADGYARGEKLRVHLLLPVRSGRNLVTVDAEVVSVDEDGVDVVFSEQEPEVIDLIVAFSFEHQRKERRRELDASTAS